MDTSWDVIIVGGGPAGTSTALNLLRRDPGYNGRVLLIEKARYPRFKLCGGGILDYARRALDNMGLDLHEVPHTQVEELRVRYGRQQVSFYQRPVMSVVRRDVFDAWLAGKAEAAGTCMHQGETVLDAETADGAVAVRTSAGTYRARTLVVAEGSKGTLRRKLGFPETGGVARLMEILTPAEDGLSRELHTRRTALFDFSGARDGLQGYYWDFPCVVDGEARINRGVYDARTAARPKADLKTILGGALAARGIDLAQVELMGHPIHWFDAQGVFSRPHVLLAGDAAGADPLFGEGISFALEYGALAAAAIADATARGDWSYADYRERLLASDYGRNLKVRRTLAGIYGFSSPAVHRVLLGAARVALDLWPGLRPYRTAPP